MSYKIAVASSGGEIIDSHFGAAGEFRIYEVENETVNFVETRKIENVNECKKGCGGGTGGCGNDPVIAAKIDVIADCRCVLAGRIGFQIQKQLERHGIAHFELTCGIQEAFDKLIPYFYKVDNHITLRNFAREN